MKLYLVPVLLVLGGCSGSNVSSSTGNSENSSISANSIISKTKEFFKAKHKSMNIEMPVSVLINEAAKDWVQDQNIKFSMPFSFNENSCNFNDEVRKEFNLVRGSKNDSLYDLMLKNKQELAEYAQSHELTSNLETKVQTINNILSLKDTNYLCARSFLINSTAPIGGWVGGVHVNNANVDFAQSIYQTALISNAIQTQVITKLSDVSSWESDRVVKNKINEIINEIVDSKDYEKILLSSIHAAHTPQYVLNFAGSTNPVEFSVDGEYAVYGSGNGISTQKSGVAWFGNNTISSKKYTLYVDSVEVASMKKSKNTDSTGSTGSENSNSNSATVSH